MKRTARALAIGALALALSSTAVYASEAPANLPPHVNPATFGILPSSGDPVGDCGEMAGHPDDLPDAAIAVLSDCLDLHGWTYDEQED